MKKYVPSKEEIALFRAAVANTRPLSKTSSTVRTATKSKAEPEPILADYWPSTVESEEKLFFSKSGVQDRTLRKLRQGQIAQSAILDLHGKTVEESRRAFLAFLRQSQARNCRCVRIVHGKGGRGSAPILKNYINSWLQQHRAVLAFSSAQPRDGGNGAVYVLIRRL